MYIKEKKFTEESYVMRTLKDGQTDGDPRLEPFCKRQSVIA